MPTSTAQALLECHYSVNNAFLLPPHSPSPPPSQRSTTPTPVAHSAAPAAPTPLAPLTSSPTTAATISPVTGRVGTSPLLQPAALATLRTAGVPCIAVQGQQDMVCPPGTAYALHQAWPEMRLRLVPNAGHSMYDPSIRHELLLATDALAAALALRN